MLPYCQLEKYKLSRFLLCISKIICCIVFGTTPRLSDPMSVRPRTFVHHESNFNFLERCGQKIVILKFHTCLNWYLGSSVLHKVIIFYCLQTYQPLKSVCYHANRIEFSVWPLICLHESWVLHQSINASNFTFPCRCPLPLKYWHRWYVGYRLIFEIQTFITRRLSNDTII